MLRGFDLAFERLGRVPLGHNVLDSRTMENRFGSNLVGMTAGIPLDSRKTFQAPARPPVPAKGEQTNKNKAAGVVVDPTAIETYQGADSVSVDTTGGYGIVPQNQGGSGGG